MNIHCTQRFTYLTVLQYANIKIFESKRCLKSVVKYLREIVGFIFQGLVMWKEQIRLDDQEKPIISG